MPMNTDAFMSAITRQGVEYATVTRPVMGLHFGDLRIDVLHLPGRTEVIKIDGEPEKRADALCTLVKAADLSDQPLRFIQGVLDDQEKKTYHIEAAGWRAPQSCYTYIYGDLGLGSHKPMIGKAAFDETMKKRLEDISTSADKGNLIILHTQNSTVLPGAFWAELDDIIADMAEEGRPCLEVSVGPDFKFERASLHLISAGHLGKHLVTHPHFEQRIGKGIMPTYDYPIITDAEQSIRNALSRRHETWTYPQPAM